MKHNSNADFVPATTDRYRYFRPIKGALAALLTRRSPGKRFLAALGIVCAALALVAAGAGLWLRGRIMASLPLLDGNARLSGLSAPVTITRDALGIPTISGSNRLDVARATDGCTRKTGASRWTPSGAGVPGELSELFGRATLPLDREARMHGFKDLARKVLDREPPAQRLLLEAYADGVNQGLEALAAKPWEYSILRATPRPWAPEDCMLITYAMTLDLQEGTGRYVRNLSTLRDTLGRASFAFFAPLSTPEDDRWMRARRPRRPSPGVGARPASEGLGRTVRLPWRGAVERLRVPGFQLLRRGRFTNGQRRRHGRERHPPPPRRSQHLVPRTLKWPGHQERGCKSPEPRL